MADEMKHDPKLEEEDKLRCASYLLEMIQRYGLKILAEEKKKKEAAEAQ